MVEKNRALTVAPKSAVSKELAALEDVPGWTAGLKPKEILFVREYLVDLNATNAALRAGYGTEGAARGDKDAAHVCGGRLLRSVPVSRAIAQALKSSLNESLKTSIVNEMGAMAFHNPDDFFTINGEDGSVSFKSSEEIGRENMKSVKKIKVTTKRFGNGENESVERTVEMELTDKQSALMNLAKVTSIIEKADAKPIVAVQVNIDKRFDGL
jgi:phage terminase small subunit